MLKLSDIDPSEVENLSRPQSAAPLKLSDVNPADVENLSRGTAESAHPDRGGLDAVAHGFNGWAYGGLDDELTGALSKIKGGDYGEARDKSRQANEDAKINHPYLHMAGSLVGAIPFTLGTGALGELAGVGKIASPVMRAAAQGGLDMGIIGAGESKADLTKGDFGGLAKDVATAAPIGAAGGALTHKLIEAAGPSIKKGLSTFLGPSEKDIDAYIANPEAINSAPTREQIYDDVSGEVNNRRMAAEQAAAKESAAQAGVSDLERSTQQGLKDDVAETQRAADQSQNALENSRREALMGAKEQAADETASVAEAKVAAKTAEQNAMGELQQAAAHPQEMTPHVVNAVNELKNQALDAEERATDSLVKNGVSIQIQPLIDRAQQILESEGLGAKKNVFTGSAKQASSEMKTILEDLESLKAHALEAAQAKAGHSLSGSLADGTLGTTPNAFNPNEVSLPARDARVFLKSINREITFPGSEGGFMTYQSRAANEFRQALRQMLIEQSGGPGSDYARIMSTEAAPAFELLSHVNRLFGDPQRAANTLKGVIGKGSDFRRGVLRDLGSYTGKDFVSPLEQFEKVQSLAKDPAARQAVTSALPETDALNLAQSRADAFKNPRYQKTQAEEAIQRSPHLPELTEAQQQLATLKDKGFQQSHIQDTIAQSQQQQALTHAAAERAKAQAALEPYKGLTDKNIEGTINSAKRGNINNSRTLEDLGNDSGKNYLEALQNRATADAFTKPGINGSRKVNLGATVLGGITGTLFGHPGIGAAVGGALGGFADTNGGQITKRILDTSLAAKQIGNNALTKVATVLKTDPKVLGQYAGVLANAASRGTQALSVTHFLLSQRNQDYREMTDKLANDSK